MPIHTPFHTHTAQRKALTVSTDLDETGPIDYLVVEFPGNRMTGEGFPLLVDLVERGIIRILDLVFVKQRDRRLGLRVEIADIDGDGSSTWRSSRAPRPACSAQDDIDEAARDPRAGQLGRDPGLRERLGRAVRRGAAARRCPAGGQRPNPGPGGPRRARRGRVPGRTTSTDTTRKEQPMPGLIRGVARTAVVAGTATAVSTASRGASRDAGPRRTSSRRRRGPARTAPAAAAPAARRSRTDDKFDQLKQLGELRDVGVLTETEFEAQKGKILYG